MNWDNQDNKDPWGNRSNGNDQDFDDLLKRFSSILGGKSGGGKGSSSGGGFNFSPSRFLGYGFFIFAVVYLSASIYTVQPGDCLLYTSPSPRDGLLSRMPSSA